MAKEKLSDVEFFGAVDRKDRRSDGRICSEYPAFYFRTHIDELRESIDSKVQGLERGEIYPTEIPKIKAELEREKLRLADIEKSKVVLKDGAKDEAAKLYADLGEQIQDSLFTRTEMMKGLANPHEEARRMKDLDIINIRGNTEVFKKMGIQTRKGKTSRTGATRAYKILGSLLGEETNVEYLRKDHKYGTFKSDVPLEEMMR